MTPANRKLLRERAESATAYGDASTVARGAIDVAVHPALLLKLLDALDAAEGDRCDTCDENGLIYVTTGFDGEREIEEAAVCPACEGTRSGVTGRVRAERDAALARAERAEAEAARLRDAQGPAWIDSAMLSRAREERSTALAQLAAVVAEVRAEADWQAENDDVPGGCERAMRLRAIADRASGSGIALDRKEEL